MPSLPEQASNAAIQHWYDKYVTEAIRANYLQARLEKLEARADKLNGELVDALDRCRHLAGEAQEADDERGRAVAGLEEAAAEFERRAAECSTLPRSLRGPGGWKVSGAQLIAKVGQVLIERDEAAQQERQRVREALFSELEAAGWSARLADVLTAVVWPFAATKAGRCPNFEEVPAECDCLACKAVTLLAEWEDSDSAPPPQAVQGQTESDREKAVRSVVGAFGHVIRDAYDTDRPDEQALDPEGDLLPPLADAAGAFADGVPFSQVFAMLPDEGVWAAADTLRQTIELALPDCQPEKAKTHFAHCNACGYNACGYADEDGVSSCTNCGAQMQRLPVASVSKEALDWAAANMPRPAVQGQTIPDDYWREVPCGHPPDPVAMYGSEGKPICHCGCLLEVSHALPAPEEAPGPIVNCQKCGCYVAIPPKPDCQPEKGGEG